MAPLVPGSWTAADCTGLESTEGASVVAESEEGGIDGASVVAAGSVVVGGAVVGAVAPAAAVTGGFT